jgi:hypothetical protein
VLENGLDNHLTHVRRYEQTKLAGNFALDNRMYQDCVRDKQLIVDWLEAFKMNFAQNLDRHECFLVISRCNASIFCCDNWIKETRVPLAIESFCENSTVLPFGLSYHLNNMRSLAVFPKELKSLLQWITQKENDISLLLTFIAEFKVQFGHCVEAGTIILDCEQLVGSSNTQIVSAKDSSTMLVARKECNNSVLEYGFDYHVAAMKSAIEKGLPSDPRFPERDTEWLQAREKEFDLLCKWLDDFRNRYYSLIMAAYADALSILNEGEELKDMFATKVQPLKIIVTIQNARNARTADGSCLEYGLKYHLDNMKSALEKGIPRDPRFPERDNEWVVARVKEYKLLAEWFEDFMSKFQQYSEA